MEDQSFQQGADSGRNQPENRRNVLVVAAVVLVVAACCCLIAAGVLVGLDPFDWNLLDRITGHYDAAAEAVPADATMYFGMDLLKLVDPDVARVFLAFAEAAPDSGVSSQEDAFRQLDEEMLDELGFTLTEDILPWVGQYAGFGFTNIAFDEFGEVESVQAIFAASVRDRSAAEDFVAAYRQKIEVETGVPMGSATYEGTDILESGEIAFALHQNLFLVGNDSDAVRAAIDAKDGESFMDSDTFRSLMDELPGGQIATLFITRTLIESFSSDLPVGLSSSGALTNANLWNSAALALAFVPEGVRVDTVVRYDSESIGPLQREMISAYEAGSDMAMRVPAGTLVMLSGQRPDLNWRLMRDQLQASGTEADMDEAMASFESEFGFNPDTDLFANLDGEYVIAALPASEGMLAMQGMNIGLTLMFETRNPTALAPVMEGLGAFVVDNFGFPPAPVDAGGIEVWQVSNPFIGEMLAYGLHEDILILATSADLAGDVLGGESSLAADPDYAAAWQPFADGMRPVFFADVQGLLGTIREGMGVEELAGFEEEVGSLLSPIDKIAMANQMREGPIQAATLVIYIMSPGE